MYANATPGRSEHIPWPPERRPTISATVNNILKERKERVIGPQSGNLVPKLPTKGSSLILRLLLKEGGEKRV